MKAQLSALSIACLLLAPFAAHAQANAAATADTTSRAEVKAEAKKAASPAEVERRRQQEYGQGAPAGKNDPSRPRSDVKAETRQANKSGELRRKDGEAYSTVSQAQSTKSRAEVKQETKTAIANKQMPAAGEGYAIADPAPAKRKPRRAAASAASL